MPFLILFIVQLTSTSTLKKATRYHTHPSSPAPGMFMFSGANQLARNFAEACCQAWALRPSPARLHFPADAVPDGPEHYQGTHPAPEAKIVPEPVRFRVVRRGSGGERIKRMEKIGGTQRMYSPPELLSMVSGCGQKDSRRRDRKRCKTERGCGATSCRHKPTRTATIKILQTLDARGTFESRKEGGCSDREKQRLWSTKVASDSISFAITMQQRP